MKKSNSYFNIAVILLLVTSVGFPCTNFLITKGASTDGSTFITYSADSHVLYGELYHWPAAEYPSRTVLDIYEWDTGKLLGQIPQATKTYNVVGNINENQVSIGETTFTGRIELQDTSGIMDYGSLMYIALQRATSARDAIKIMTDLVAEYGYYSTGESFSIADPDEVWLLEMIGKGPSNKGAVWVARKIPDGYISAHANQARIRQFPKDDPDNCLFAPDVISVAREKGYFDGKDKDFSFADAYAPPDFGALRFCEARVWSMFRRAAPSQEFSIEYVKGDPTAGPLPLWIKPERKLNVQDVKAFMRDHFENSPFDLSQGIGAGPYHLPYRWRPLTWKVDSVEYCNERSTSTQQTGFSFVAQARSWLPNEIGGVLWFGVDDTYSTVYIPMYCSMTEVPNSFAVGTGSFNNFTWDSGFWVFNFVSNYAYSRYNDMIKDIQVVQQQLEGQFVANQKNVDEAALVLYNQTPQLARDYLTKYSVDLGQSVVKRWKSLGERLIFKYLDGNVKDELNNVTHPGYPNQWYRRIVKENGEHFKMPEGKAGH